MVYTKALSSGAVKNPPADLARRLLDVGAQVLHGEPPLRLEDVAALVGASRATLYYYFAGRDDLIAFILAEHARQGAETVSAAVDPDDPPELRLRAMVAALAGYLGRHPGTCAGVLGAFGGPHRMREVLQAIDSSIARPLRTVLAAGRDGGVFTVSDVTDAANAILGGLLLGVLGRSMTGADTTDPRFLRQVSEQAVRSILTR
jgi:AcrR family transcriptional regulator